MVLPDIKFNPTILVCIYTFIYSYVYIPRKVRRKQAHVVRRALQSRAVSVAPSRGQSLAEHKWVCHHVWDWTGAAVTSSFRILDSAARSQVMVHCHVWTGGGGNERCNHRNKE